MAIKNITEEVTALRKLHLRVEQLENINKDFDYQRPIANHAERLEKLEMYLDGLRGYQVVERINDLRELVYKHGQMAGTIEANRGNKKPYKCPVCEGKGQWFEAPKNEYHCNSCEGKGIVWG